MGLLSLVQRRSLENPSTSLANPAEWLMRALGAGQTFSGVAVSPSSAMRLSAVTACQRIISETIASLPLPTYERLPKGKKKAPDHEVYPLLHDMSNPEMTAFTFRETLQHHLCGWGNAYAEKELDNAGRLRGLWPLLPDRTRVERKGGQKRFFTRIPEGKGEREVELSADRVFHIPGLGFDGLKGYGYLTLHRELIGIAMASEEFAGRFFGSGMHLGVVIEHPMKLSPEAKERIRSDIEYLQGGLSQAHRMAIFEEGMKASRLGVPPDEAQFLETRKFHIEEIARIYRVPLHMLQVGGPEAGQSYASVEQKSLEFVQYTIRPWLVRWEQAILSQLFMAGERSRFFAEHLVDGLLRGDFKSRMDGHAVARQWGLASYNDVAARENWDLDETPYGDMKFMPLNMVPGDMAREVAAGGTKESAPEQPASEAKPDGASLAERFAILLDRRGCSHYRLFEQTMGRIVRLEVQALRRVLKGAADVAGFVQGAERFYSENWSHDSTRLLSPSIFALSGTLADDVGEWTHGVGAAREAEIVAQNYVLSYADVHAEHSMAALRAVIASSENPLDGIARELDRWETERAPALARETTRQAPLALARGIAPGWFGLSN